MIPGVALRTILLADAGVTALVDDRVFTPELPDDQAADMPRHAVVLRCSDAPGIGSRSYLPVVSVRADTFCYGATPYEAERLKWRVLSALKAVQRTDAGGMLVYPLTVESGGMPTRDPDTDWPVIWTSYRAHMEEPVNA